MIQLRLIALCILVFLCGNVYASSGICLIKDGKPNATIIVASDMTPAANLAATELQYHIEKITGAVLPIQSDLQEVQGNRILVGESAATREIGLKGSDFKPQEYLIQVSADTIILIGRDWLDTPKNRSEVGVGNRVASLQDSRPQIDYNLATGRKSDKTKIELPGVFDDQGTCYATYDFLERFCGVRWYGPRLINIVIPQQSSITLSETKIRRSPGFPFREIWQYAGWSPVIKAQYDNSTKDEQNLHYRRLRIGGERWVGNHSFGGYFDRFLQKNPKQPELWEEYRPEYFAQGYGDLSEFSRSHTQLCYTNESLIQQVAQDARDYFDGKGLKGRQTAIGDYFCVIPMDGRGWCKCDKCQAMLAVDSNNTWATKTPPGFSHKLSMGHKGFAMYSSGLASHYVFSFVNAVAREVIKTHPQKYISTLAYNQYFFRPDDIELLPNIAVAPCIMAPFQPVSLHSAVEIAEYKKWVEKKDRPIFLWNYDSPYRYQMYKKQEGFVGFNAHAHSRYVKMFYKDGVRGTFFCGYGEQLDYYALAKLYDDPTLDIDMLINEFFSHYFGAASDPMKKFYLQIESIYSDPLNYPSEISTLHASWSWDPKVDWEYLATSERIDQLSELIQKAEASAVTETEKKRVGLWKKGVWDYMMQGRQKYLNGESAGKMNPNAYGATD